MKRLSLLVAAAFVLCLLCGCVAQKRELWLEGVCLVADSGSVLLIAKDDPIVLHDRSGDGLLEGIQTGDRIRVLHDGLAESFPAQAGIYKLVKTGEGSIDDISPKTLDMLRQLGWID